MVTKLHKFEGREVIGAKVAITGAGDGLSQAMAVEPVELTLGQTVYVVLECTVDKIVMERVKDTDALTRVQRLRAGTASLVDKALVADVLIEQRRRIDAALGIEQLDFVGGDDADSE